MKNKWIAHNIFRIQDNGSVVSVFYFIGFEEYMVLGRNLLDYTNLFSSIDYEKNEKRIYNYFKYEYGKSRA